MHGGKARPKSAKFVSYSLVLPHELSGHTIWCTCGVTLWLPTGALNGYARNMALSERQLLDVLSWTPFVGELGEPHTTVHRTLANLLTDGIVGRVSPAC